jgi:hypothetical protein
MDWVFNQKIDSQPLGVEPIFAGALLGYELKRKKDEYLTVDEICTKADYFTLLRTSNLERTILLANKPSWPCPGAGKELCKPRLTLSEWRCQS